MMGPPLFYTINNWLKPKWFQWRSGETSLLQKMTQNIWLTDDSGALATPRGRAASLLPLKSIDRYWWTNQPTCTYWLESEICDTARLVWSFCFRDAPCLCSPFTPVWSRAETSRGTPALSPWLIVINTADSCTLQVNVRENLEPSGTVSLLLQLVSGVLHWLLQEESSLIGAELIFSTPFGLILVNIQQRQTFMFLPGGEPEQKPGWRTCTAAVQLPAQVEQQEDIREEINKVVFE